MNDPLIKRARECRFFQGALMELAAELPSDDAALDQLLADTVAARENDAFTHVILSALSAGRRVDARHLAAGAALFPDPRSLIAVSMHLSGDVARPLIDAVARGGMGNEREGTALLLAGVWCREKNQPFPTDLIAQARILARRAGDNYLVRVALRVLAHLVRDDGFSAVLNRGAAAPSDPSLPAPEDVGSAEYIDSMIKPVRKSVLGLVPERPGPIVHSGFTLRRAVPRVGRNDPCPCGSGKKYKHCCITKDQQRLQSSSAVPGLTVEELHEQKERFLTQAQLLEMRSYELARLDPVKVADALKPALINRLHLFGEVEAVVQLFEKVGVSEELEGHWEDAVDNATRAARKDLVERLLKLREVTGAASEELRLATRLLCASETDSTALKLVEEQAVRGLNAFDPNATFELAYALLEGRYPALGIFVARGVISTSSLWEADMLFDALLEARDRLNLPPDDPLQPFVDRMYTESVDEFRDSKALQEAHSRLEAKSREVSQLRTELAELHQEMNRIERKQAKPPSPSETPASPPAASVDPAAFTELRRRVAVLKGELNERHAERNQLRRDLRSALEHLETLQRRNAAPAEPANESSDAEDRLLGAEESLRAQPIRLPEFSGKFSESLAPLPQPVVRRTMALIGRLAAGEDAAFAGVKPLKTIRKIYRQRVGADHRLLFRLNASAIEFVALINRRDLERTIRNLSG